MRNPYVTGAYVVGRQHYGRRALIDRLLHGEGRAYWVVGSRRIGKTSLLRELERRALEDADSPFIPLVWDMQGCNSFACLSRYLIDAVGDHPERFEPLQLPVKMLGSEDASAFLGQARRRALQAGRELFLLCDETEVLIDIARGAPQAMQQLHKQLTAGAGLRVVMTSTRQIYRLHDVCRDWPTSSFLAGFDMSHTLGSLGQHAAVELIQQAQEPPEHRVTADPDTVAAISEATNNHPLLLQTLCSRLFREDGVLAPPDEKHLYVDSILAGFFEHDFRLLTEADRQILLAVHRNPDITPERLAADANGHSAEMEQRLYNLEGLGYLRRRADRVAIGNRFLANWLSMQGQALDKLPPLQTSDTAMRKALTRHQPRERNALLALLNARRGRLVELEAMRARDFLAVAPQVLDEIEQMEGEIRDLRSLLRQG
ncbi:MAG: hypothetical protein BWY52_01810 [Chloroflexi bacterium ADurb.Bin325]|nr:MAG: hypothetical protein BWY52_01810 [Chloroflexi bacterium ADurb.Bin325]